MYGAAYPPGIGDHYWLRARNLILLRLLRRWGGPSGFDPVLDVGCGPGLFVKWLRDAGVDCWGCDLGRPAPLTAVADYLLLGHNLEELPVPDGARFHTALLLDVLEHVDLPARFLHRLRESLPGLQRLVVTVPARHELWSNYDAYFGHRCRFTSGMLRDTLAAGGFRVVYWRHLYHALYPPALLLVKLGFHRRVDMQAPRHPGLHRLVSDYFNLESRIMPRCLPGSSLVAFAVPSPSANPGVQSPAADLGGPKGLN